MFIFVVVALCAIQFLSQLCSGISYVSLPLHRAKKYPPVRYRKTLTIDNRKYWLQPTVAPYRPFVRQFGGDDDLTIKSKIALLMDRTQKDVKLKMKSLTETERTVYEREGTIYNDYTVNRFGVGRYLSLIRKCKVMMNELYNIAITHKNDWKVLEQLKIYEMILDVNHHTWYYVECLLDIQIHYLNKTAGDYDDDKSEDVDDKDDDVTDKGDNVDDNGDFVDDKGDTVTDKGDNVDDKGDFVDDKGDTVTDKGDNVDDKGDTFTDKGDNVDDKGDNVDEQKKTYEPPMKTTEDSNSVPRKLY